QTEVTNWLNFLQSHSRAEVANSFLTSREYRQIVVRGYYFGPNSLLQRSAPPTQTEVDRWTNSGLDFTSIRVSFEASQEYYNLVSGEEGNLGHDDRTCPPEPGASRWAPGARGAVFSASLFLCRGFRRVF